MSERRLEPLKFLYSAIIDVHIADDSLENMADIATELVDRLGCSVRFKKNERVLIVSQYTSLFALKETYETGGEVD